MRRGVSLVALLISCSGPSGGDAPKDAHVAIDASVDAPGSFAVGGAVHNLVGTGLTLALDGATLTIAADGPFAFPTPKPYGDAYAVTIATQPAGQTCSVHTGSGTIAGVVASVVVNCTVGALRITELSNCYFANGSCWFEVVNTSQAAVDLSAYSLRAAALKLSDASVTEIHTYTLPAYSVPAGGRVVIRGRSSPALASGRNVVSLVDDDFVPFWYMRGFLELVLDGRTADLVRVGADTTHATTFGWFGAGISAPSTVDYSHAIARDSADTDTDAAADWTEHAFGTPGGPNDITSDADADQDGIPDQAEVAGGTYAGLDLYAMGCRTNQRDMLVEIDRMTNSDEGSIPHKPSIDRLVAAYVPHGIHVHVDAGALFSATFDPANYNLGGGNDQVAFETVTQFDEIYGWKAANMDIRRQEIAHYMVYVNTLPNAGGLGELGGNDLLVAFATGGLNTQTTANANRLFNDQSSTMMHELGHNLGLSHGGNEEHNYKPNYRSVMNYFYAHEGLPHIGSNEGDRYAMVACGVGNELSLVDSPESATFVLDYSDGSSGNLTETALVEASGLRRTGSTGVDFNCDTAIANSSYDIDHDSTVTATPMSDYDDWGHLELRFNRSYLATPNATSNAHGRIATGEIRSVVAEDGSATRPLPRR